MADWQPIETAPRNTPVLVFSPDASEPKVLLAHCLDFGDGDGAEWYDVWQETGYPIDADPSHWQPLPEPPATDGTAEDRERFSKHPYPLDEYELLDALAGLVGLIQLLLSRDDLPMGLRTVIETNHRFAASLRALSAGEG